MVFVTVKHTSVIKRNMYDVVKWYCFAYV